ncbi:MAG TPA: hypothetical protein VHE09_15205, partial [Rhizomicrobium sp.]|nr:hypothetical protein [Rhizomicrobium sp.]
EARAPRMRGRALSIIGKLARFNEAEARAPRMLNNLKVMAAVINSFNEAEARAPRMRLPYKPLDTKAISPRFRATVYQDGRGQADSKCARIHDVKERCDSNNLPRFERVRGSAQHVAARKHPAGTKRVQ